MEREISRKKNAERWNEAYRDDIYWSYVYACNIDRLIIDNMIIKYYYEKLWYLDI